MLEIELAISLDRRTGRKLGDEERSERLRLANGASELERLAQDLDIERATEESVSEGCKRKEMGRTASGIQDR